MDLDPIPAAALQSCEDLCNSLNLSEPLFIHWQNGDKNSAYFTELWLGLNKTISQCIAGPRVGAQ